MKIEISPSQALLLLMNVYDESTHEYHELYSLYLNGIIGRQKERFDFFCTHLCLKPFQIVFDSKFISDDATRRYFETHLAYETVYQQIDELDTDSLVMINIKLIEFLSSITQVDEGYHQEFWQMFDKILNARASDIDLKSFVITLRLFPFFQFHEYYKLISDIRNQFIFTSLSEENRNKLKLIVSNSFLALLANKLGNTSIPLNNIFLSKAFKVEHRGKIQKLTFENDEFPPISLHHGILKSYMAIPVNDIARASLIFRYKPSDKSNFDEHAFWPKIIFSYLVHPFVNSISGTLLAQIRFLSYLREEAQLHGLFTARLDFINYFRSFVSVMLYGSGGHSLFEFVHIFNHPDLQTFYDKEFHGQFFLSDFFVDGNMPAFDRALKKTQWYNKHFLAKKQIHQELKQCLRPGFFKSYRINNEPEPLEVASINKPTRFITTV